MDTTELAWVWSHQRSTVDPGKCYSFDIAGDPSMDITNFEHRKLLTQAICGVEEGGLVWFAPPCSSWVWISAHTGKRGKEPGHLKAT